MTTRRKTARPPASIGERLKQTMLAQDINSAALAKRANVKTSFLYDVISGKSANPSSLKLARVADALGVSLTYLAGGAAHAGEALPDAKHYLSIPALVTEALQGKSAPGAKATAAAAATFCRFHRQWAQRQLGANPDNLRLLQVRDDGMEPTLRPRDTVLLDTGQRLPSPPGIFALFDRKGLLVKRLEYAGVQAPDQVRIISDNTRYSTYDRPVGDIFIIGRVVWMSREI